MDVLGKYHQCTLERCNTELGLFRGQLAEQQKEFQKELDYRNGIILRLEKERNDVVMKLEKEKNDLRTEMESRILEARKLASVERLDVRPSPMYHHTTESEPESSHGSHSRDLESVISRLKNKHNSRLIPRRRHTHDVTSEPGPEPVPIPVPVNSVPEPSQQSVLSQAEQVPHQILVNVQVTEQVVEIKQEYDVDDNEADVLSVKEVSKPDTPTPTGDSGIDIVDEATISPSTSTGTGTSQVTVETDRTSESISQGECVASI